MKTVLIIILLGIATPILAQHNCSKYYASQPGVKLIHKHLDKRDRLMMRSEYIVTAANAIGVDVDFNLWDKDGEIMTNGSFTMGCENRTTYLAPETITANLLRQYPQIEYEVVVNDAVGIPNNLSIGQELSAGSVSIEIDTQFVKIGWESTVTDRRVVAQEDITTPAGTFSCYVIDQTNILRGRLGTKTYDQTVWIAEGIGMVMEETRKQNGRLVNATILEYVEGL